MDRRGFLKSLSAGTAAFALARAASRFGSPPSPNIVLILADDLGFGDVGIYGSKLSTPNLNKMAAEGVRFNQFYSPAPVCSPARAGLLTGRYAVRSGVSNVLFPDSAVGIPEGELTLPMSLKSAGYQTYMAGKWHLGCQPEFMPTRRGFDEFFGVPYSNDMVPLPLIHNTTVLEANTDNNLLTQRYSQQAVQWIGAPHSKPFFLYLAHNVPHIPLGASPQFRGSTRFGAYGDAVAELDWSVGQVLAAIKAAGLDDNTLVLFSSDNGPWYQGSPGGLRGRKGETYEGGMREPFIVRMPGRIPAGRVSNMVGSLLDVFPTLAWLVGAPGPDQPADGVNLWPVISGERTAVERGVLLYFDDWDIQCARLGRWKLHISRANVPPWIETPPEGRINLPLPKPELYDIQDDPRESYECGDLHPAIVQEIQARILDLMPQMPVEVQNAWTATLNAQTLWSPVGAPPVPKK